MHRRPALVQAANDAIVEPWARAHRAFIERALKRSEIGPAADIDMMSHATAWMAAYRSMPQQEVFDIGFLTSVVDEFPLLALCAAPVAVYAAPSPVTHSDVAAAVMHPRLTNAVDPWGERVSTYYNAGYPT